ncbi:MAG: hypothetical protein HYS08_08195 [Chlamydiae bacterium]|nr:hypothetical protein [Chlamydiota bacterium]MBI3266027.1 hypothetical protein [Chlamydiota bacterium]
MKKIFLLLALLLNLISFFGCETPDATLNEASQDIQKGITGQGRLEEKGWEDVEVYQN